MSKYAVLRIKGHQYKVSEKDEFLVDFLGDEKPEAEVLMIAEEGKVELGKPTLENKVTLKVVEPEVKGEKLYIAKYKSKSRERRRIGFRPKYTKLLVQTIK
jgi:large subunit ribosomal protein L21